MLGVFDYLTLDALATVSSGSNLPFNESNMVMPSVGMELDCQHRVTSIVTANK